MLEQLKRVEIDRYADNERGHSEELKRIGNRKSELEQLRTAARAMEAANRLNQEEEMAELRMKDVAGRRSTVLQSGKNKKRSTQVEDGEEEPLKTSSKVKMNSYKSSRRPHVAPEVFTEDEEEHFQPRRSSETRNARQKLSNTQLEDQLTEEELYSAPKKGPKVDRKPQSPPGSPPREVDDLMAQFQGLGMHSRDSPHGSGSTSPVSMHFSPYGSPPSLPPSMAPYGWYGYGGGGPSSIVNTGVGNITNTTISNVGNDNSVRKMYRK